jgi:hypothetical protein
MRALIQSIRGRWLSALLLAFAAALASCGGGSSSATQYTSVAMAGELLDYTIDPVALTYSYTITESQFGLTGKSGSGTLTRNLDGTYSPSGMPNVRIVVLPNGLLLGAVRERFGASVITVPIIGLSNPVSGVTALAGAYNYLSRSCVGVACNGVVGTFVISANGTWASCPNADIGTAAPCPAGGHAGTLNALGNGRFQVTEGSTVIGTAIGFNSVGQNVLLIDLKDHRATGGFGVGIVVGSQQVTLTTAQTNGTWVGGSNTGNWSVFDVTNTTVAISSVDGVAVPQVSPFVFDITPNTPWSGVATTPTGGFGFVAGSGVFVLQEPSGFAEIGVKIR